MVFGYLKGNNRDYNVVICYMFSSYYWENWVLGFWVVNLIVCRVLMNFIDNFVVVFVGNMGGICILVWFVMKEWWIIV